MPKGLAHGRMLPSLIYVLGPASICENMIKREEAESAGSEFVLLLDKLSVRGVGGPVVAGVLRQKRGGGEHVLC